MRCQIEPLEPRTLLAVGVPGDGIFDLTFVSDLYTDMNAFHADVRKVVDNLLSIEPYKSRQGQLAVHTIDNTVPLGSNVQDRLLLLDFGLVRTIVENSGIRTDFAAVIANLPTYGGSGGDISTTTNDPSSLLNNVFPHEFAHSIAHLQDEYLYPDAADAPLDGALHTNLYAGAAPAPGWADLVAPDEYALGGGAYRNWLRPSPSSLMRSTSDVYFNAVSQELINDAFDHWAGPLNDSLAPTVTFVGLNDGDSVAGVVPVSVEATDNLGVTRAQLWVDGRLVRNDTLAPFTLWWKTGSEALGAHRIQVRAYDSAGNVGFSPEILVNLTRASDFEVSPAGPLVNGSLDLRVGAWPDEIGSFQILVDGAAVQGAGRDAADPSLVHVFAGTIPPGSHQVTVIAMGVDGTELRRATTTITTGDPNAIVLAVDTPTAESIVKGIVPVRVSVLSGLPGALTLTVDGKRAGTDPAAPFEFTLNTKKYKDGRHTITVREPATGASASVVVQIRNQVDRRVPTVRITTPRSGAKIGGGGLIVAGNAKDASGISRVELYLDGLLVDAASASQFRFQDSLRGLSAGKHRLRVRAYDAAGNAGWSSTVVFRKLV
jgi:hypothetical protein